MKHLELTRPITFYRAPDIWIDPQDDLPLDHDLSISSQSTEACLLSNDPAGMLFVSVGERLEDWKRRRKGKAA